jgi:hypothetical protein
VNIFKKNPKRHINLKEMPKISLHKNQNQDLCLDDHKVLKIRVPFSSKPSDVESENRPRTAKK